MLFKYRRIIRAERRQNVQQQGVGIHLRSSYFPTHYHPFVFLSKPDLDPEKTDWLYTGEKKITTGASLLWTRVWTK